MLFRADFAAMAEQLAGLKGRFLMSINDVPEVRDIFSRFRIEPAAATYTIGDGARPAAELLISSA